MNGGRRYFSAALFGCGYAALVLLAGYCVLIVAVSLGGGWLPSVWKLSHLGTQLLMSLVGGMMIGVSLLHLLPHAVVHLPNLTWMSWSLLVGILSMLFLLRFGHVHFHGESHAPTVADIPMQGPWFRRPELKGKKHWKTSAFDRTTSPQITWIRAVCDRFSASNRARG